MKQLYCPVERDRIKILLYNAITLLNVRELNFFTLEEKLDVLREELGFTDEEIKQLEIIENCL